MTSPTENLAGHGFDTDTLMLMYPAQDTLEPGTTFLQRIQEFFLSEEHEQE